MKQIPLWFSGFLISAVLLNAYPGTAKELIINSDMQYDYALECFETHDFATAIVELKRFIHFFPEDGRYHGAVFLSGVSLFNLGRLDEAAIVFQRATQLPDNHPLSIEAHIMLSKVSLKQGQASLAEAELRNVLMLTHDKDIQDRVHAALGWIYLEKAQALEPHALEKAESWFRKISPENATQLSSPGILDGITAMQHLKGKNPVLAGFAGLVPGGGFAYSERFHDAMVAFFVNTALILATVRSFDTNNPALGGIVGIIASGFYAGTIYGGISSAYKYNSAQRREVIDPLKQTMPEAVPPLSSSGSGPRFQFSMRFPF